MKRRVLSLIITLALCLNVCPVWVLAADGGGAVALSIGPGESSYIMSSDDSLSYTYEVKNNYLIDTQGHTLSGSQSSVIRVTGTGALNLTGKVVTKSGVGVEVQSGGSLNITGENTYIEGSTYARCSSTPLRRRIFGQPGRNSGSGRQFCRPIGGWLRLF